MAYEAPLDDILSALKVVADFDAAAGFVPDADTIHAVLGEAGRFAAGVLEPLNRTGDVEGAHLVGGRVVTPKGWKEAYRQFAEAGWTSLGVPERLGGQGLPAVLSVAVNEIWSSANLAFALGPVLTTGAIHCIEIAGSDAIKARYLPNMVSGTWTGTMNLTEPQAGSDLNAIAARAVPQADGTYRIFGTKIFISYGDHELTDNIIHLVLARLPDAPPGTQGISLFVVPKVLVNGDGSLGQPNDVACAGLEHKLGIHASPTAVLKFGENQGAVGWLVGKENHGLATMFIMMNAARLAVGVQGVAVAERATQRAVAYANERRQGREPRAGSREMAPIIVHPDVRRMLLTMRSLTQAARAICLATAAATDHAHHAASEDERRMAADRVALLTPVAKAFGTDVAVEVASLGIQVHGGTGFIEETGAAQDFRDARILPIYEGTNGIQAIDLVTRKLALGGGAAAETYLDELAATVADVERADRPDFGKMGTRMTATLTALRDATQWMRHALTNAPDEALAGATPYLRLFALAAGGHYLAKTALAATRDDAGAASPGVDAIRLARFFAESITTAGPGLAETVIEGGAAVVAGPVG